jgi:hypothetical protein
MRNEEGDAAEVAMMLDDAPQHPSGHQKRGRTYFLEHALEFIKREAH